MPATAVESGFRDLPLLAFGVRWMMSVPVPKGSVDSGSERQCPSPSSVLLWLGLAAVTMGLMLRFSALGERVLTPAEASNTWPAWVAANGSEAPAIDTRAYAASPILDNILWLIFQCLGASDTLARCASALVGSLLVLFPWFFRDWLGNWGVGTAMVLLALDPWEVAFSRMADGTIFSAFFALAALACAEGLDRAFRKKPVQSSSVRRASTTLAVVSALFLASGKESWSFLPAVAFYAILIVGYGSRSVLWDCHAFRPGFGGRVVGIFAASLFLAASFFGIRWGRLPDLGQTLTDWIRSWNATVNHVYTWNWVLDRSFGEQALTVAAGLVGLCMLWRGRGESDPPSLRQRALSLSLWALWGLILAVPGGRGPAGVLIMDLALKLSAAFALGRLMADMVAKRRGRSWLGLLGVIVALISAGPLWIQFYRDRLHVFDSAIHLYLLLGILVILPALFIRRLRFKLESALVLAAVLFATGLNESWRFSRLIGTQPVFFDALGHQDLRRLEHDVRQWVSLYHESHDEVHLMLSRDLPGGSLSAWYLRDSCETNSGPDLDREARSVISVTREGATAHPPAEVLSPVRFRVNIRRQPAAETHPPSSESRLPVYPQCISEAVLLWLPKH